MAIPSLIPTAINLKLESAGPLLVVEQLISSFCISLRYSDSNLNGYKSLLVTLGSAECRSLELPLVFYKVDSLLLEYRPPTGRSRSTQVAYDFQHHVSEGGLISLFMSNSF